MSEERVRELVQELVKELESTPELDKELHGSVKKLQSDVEDLVNPEVDTTENTILDDAIALEAIFATNHPMAERVMRELINTLSRIGI